MWHEVRQTPYRCEPGRTGPGAGRSAASAVERSRLRQTQGSIACLGGDAGAAAQYGEDQRRAGKTGRSGDGCRDSAGYQPASAAETRTPWRRGVWRRTEGRHRSPESEARGPLPGVWKRERIRTERAEGTGADSGTDTAGGPGLLAESLPLRGL